VTDKRLDIRQDSQDFLGLQDKLLACIHCGLCLEACPTYVITGNENDGPRGRLYLMRAVGEGRLETTSNAFATHIDRCLGCRACEQVCPAGVEYGQLLEASREVLLEAQPKTDLANRLLRFVLRHVWLSPWRLRMFFGASRIFRDLGLARVLLKIGLMPQRVKFGMALLERSKGVFHAAAQRRNGRRGSESVLMFKGCVGEGLFARVNRATERVLEANDFDIEIPTNQVCCGALHAHAGDLEGARELARKNMAAFDSDAPIVTNAGGCGAMLTTYAHLFANDEELAERASSFSARVRDDRNANGAQSDGPKRDLRHFLSPDVRTTQWRSVRTYAAIGYGQGFRRAQRHGEMLRRGGRL